MLVFLNLAERNDLGLYKGIPCFKSGINITPIYLPSMYTISWHFEVSYYDVLFLPPKKEMFSCNAEKLMGYCSRSSISKSNGLSGFYVNVGYFVVVQDEGKVLLIS